MAKVSPFVRITIIFRRTIRCPSLEFIMLVLFCRCLNCGKWLCCLNCNIIIYNTLCRCNGWKLTLQMVVERRKNKLYTYLKYMLSNILVHYVSDRTIFHDNKKRTKELSVNCLVKFSVSRALFCTAGEFINVISTKSQRVVFLFSCVGGGCISSNPRRTLKTNFSFLL